jgi:hypothetical protein
MPEKESEIEKKLEVISRLLAFSIVKDRSVNEQIEVLTKAGLKASDIAVLLDKTENQVYVTQTMLRKKKRESAEPEKHPKESDKEEIPQNG